MDEKKGVSRLVWRVIGIPTDKGGLKCGTVLQSYVSDVTYLDSKSNKKRFGVGAIWRKKSKVVFYKKNIWNST